MGTELGLVIGREIIGEISPKTQKSIIQIAPSAQHCQQPQPRAETCLRTMISSGREVGVFPEKLCLFRADVERRSSLWPRDVCIYDT